jgi:hypothetical protein
MNPTRSADITQAAPNQQQDFIGSKGGISRQMQPKPILTLPVQTVIK